MQIVKTVFTITVLSTTLEAPRDTDDLFYIATEIEEGEWVGHVEKGPALPIPNDEVEAELRKIGADVAFFDFDFEEKPS